MSMYEQFKTDPELERNGVQVDYGEFRVTLARAGGANNRYQKVMEARAKPFRRAIQSNNLDNSTAQRLLREVFAETVVLNWEVKVNGKWKKGIESPDGGKDLLPVNAENLMLTFENLPDLFLDLQDQAASAVLFKQSLQEEAGGN